MIATDLQSLWVKLRVLSLTLGLLATSKATAATVVLNFDELVGMPNTQGTTVPAASRLSNAYLNLYGIAFSSASPFVTVLDQSHEFNGGNAAPSFPNCIGGADAQGRYSLFGDAPVVGTFFDPANSATTAVTDFVSMRSDLNWNLSNMLLVGYDVNGNQIASANGIDTGGTVIQLAVPGIHQWRFFGSGSVAIDDVTFNTVTPVPEPPAFILGIFGLFGLLTITFRRQSLLTAAQHFADNRLTDFHASGEPCGRL